MVLTRIQVAILSGFFVVALGGTGPLAGALAQDMTAESGTGQAVSDMQALDRGRDLYFSGDYQGAYAIWQPLADAGNARALYNLSTLYRLGYGVDKDVEKAASLLRSSAEKGFSDAQYLYATTIFDDAGDDEAQKQEAVRWWLLAARQGNGLSQYRLGLMYWNGVAVARDLVRGRAWMGLAARGGIAEAQDALKSMDRYLDDTQLGESDQLMAELFDTGAQPSEPQKVAAQGKPAALARQDMVSSTAAVTQNDGAGAVAESVREAAPITENTSSSARPEPVDFDKSWRLQLMALKDANDVKKEWTRLSAAAPDLLGDLVHRVVPAHLGERGTFYRLYIGPFGSRDAANDRCRALKAAGMGCFIVAPDR